jgi:CRISPR type III-A-associated RAMP protein Csm5
MQTSQLELHRVNLHILSPIHIGAGQELDPFSYTIRDNNLLLIDLIKWIEEYPEQEQLHRIMDSDNFAELRTFIAENIDTDSITLGSIPVESRGLLKTFNRVIKAKDPRNQLLIDGMTRNEISQIAFIPGSSIKGSVRTAIANHFVEAAGVTSKNKRKTFNPVEPDYNEKIFGKINKDPMRNAGNLWFIPCGFYSNLFPYTKRTWTCILSLTHCTGSMCPSIKLNTRSFSVPPLLKKLGKKSLQ